MRKRITAIMLVLSIIVTALPLSGCQRAEEPENKEGYVTRGEWVAMLAEKFDLNTYLSDEPYYSDITAEDAVFPYVQSSAEWGILSVYDEEVLEADRLVTRDEAASTAAIAVGFKADERGRYDIKDSIAYSVEREIVSADGSDYLTYDECASIVEKAYTVYMNDSGEEKTVVVTNEDAVDLSEASPSDITAEGDKVTVASGEISESEDGILTASVSNGRETVEISVGDTFITPESLEYPWGIAYKVVDIEEENGGVVFATESPTLEDLYEEIDVHTVSQAALDDIVWADGVSASSDAEEDYAIGTMSLQSASPKIAPMGKSSASYSNSWKVKIREGELEKTWENTPGTFGDSKYAKTFENSNFAYDGTPSVEDFNGSTDSWTKKLSAKSKFSDGYEITGNLKINTLTVTTDIQYKKGQIFNTEIETPIPKSASLSLSSDITASLDIEGTLSGSLKIATVPIQLPVPGLSVSVDIYLYTDASGTLQVKAEFGHAVKVEWRDGEKLRKLQESDSDISTEAALDLNFGADVSASLDAFGLEIMDAGVKAGGNLTAEATLSGECKETEEDGEKVLHYKQSLNLKADLYVPVITLYVGGSDSLLEKVGISGSWEVVGKDNGAKCVPLIEHEWVFWEETVTLSENSEPVVSENEDISDESTPVVSANGVELNNTYTTRFEDAAQITYPKFSFNYPDGWTVATGEAISDQAPIAEDVVAEMVELKNDRGVTITYSMLLIPEYAINHGSKYSMRTADITKAADSSFVPHGVQGTDHSDLGSFMVAKAQVISMYDLELDDFTPVENGTVYYAVIPESYVDESSSMSLAGPFALSFWYSSSISMIAEAPGNSFTEQEEQEVIAILSSFRHAE